MLLRDTLNSLCTVVAVNDVSCCKQQNPNKEHFFLDAASVSGQEETKLITFARRVVKIGA